jgi:hypothetical protein
MAATHVNVKTLMDEVASSNTYFATAARPNTSFTMAATTFAAGHNGGGAVITATTAGAADSGKTVTLTGTDLVGVAQTEVITLPGSATTTSGTKYFLTVTAAEMSAQPAANVSLGFNGSRGMGIFGGRTALKGFTCASGNTAGDVSFISTSTLTSSSTAFMKYRTLGTPNTESHFTAPPLGVLCADGLYVTYTLDVTDQMNIFYNG